MYDKMKTNMAYSRMDPFYDLNTGRQTSENLNLKVKARPFSAKRWYNYYLYVNNNYCFIFKSIHNDIWYPSPCAPSNRYDEFIGQKQPEISLIASWPTIAPAILQIFIFRLDPLLLLISWRYFWSFALLRVASSSENPFNRLSWNMFLRIFSEFP